MEPLWHTDIQSDTFVFLHPFSCIPCISQCLLTDFCLLQNYPCYVYVLGLPSKILWFFLSGLKSLLTYNHISTIPALAPSFYLFLFSPSGFPTLISKLSMRCYVSGVTSRIPCFWVSGVQSLASVRKKLFLRMEATVRYRFFIAPHMFSCKCCTQGLFISSSIWLEQSVYN